MCTYRKWRSHRIWTIRISKNSVHICIIGTGTYHAFTGDDHDVITNNGEEELLDLRKYIGSSVVIKAKGNYRIISFNSWRQNEIWQGRLLDQNEVEISSKHLYSTLVCFKGTLKINDKEVPEMTYVELKQNKIYNIDSSDSFVGLFEEGYAWIES